MSNIDIPALLSNLGVSSTYATPYNLEAIAAGKPVSVFLKSTKLENCYYDYHEICLNYDGSDACKPNGLCGKVCPTKVEVVDGVTVAFFHYSIDSGD